MGHMWYMPMILGLYLFLPFMANGLKIIDDARVLVFPLVISVALFFVTPIVNVVLESYGKSGWATIVNAGFGGGVYGTYLLFGYCVKKGLLSRIPVSVLVAVFVGAFAIIVGLRIFGFAHGVKAKVWYSSGLLLLAGLCLCLLLSHLKVTSIPKMVHTLSYYSFALYLVHYPVKILVTPWVETWGLSGRSFEILVATVVLAVGLALCALIARIPKVGAKVLYLR